MVNEDIRYIVEYGLDNIDDTDVIDDNNFAGIDGVDKDYERNKQCVEEQIYANYFNSYIKFNIDIRDIKDKPGILKYIHETLFNIFLENSNMLRIDNHEYPKFVVSEFKISGGSSIYQPFPEKMPDFVKDYLTIIVYLQPFKSVPFSKFHNVINKLRNIVARFFKTCGISGYAELQYRHIAMRLMNYTGLPLVGDEYIPEKSLAEIYSSIVLDKPVASNDSDFEFDGQKITLSDYNVDPDRYDMLNLMSVFANKAVRHMKAAASDYDIDSVQIINQGIEIYNDYGLSFVTLDLHTVETGDYYPEKISKFLFYDFLSYLSKKILDFRKLVVYIKSNIKMHYKSTDGYIDDNYSIKYDYEHFYNMLHIIDNHDDYYQAYFIFLDKNNNYKNIMPKKDIPKDKRKLTMGVLSMDAFYKGYTDMTQEEVKDKIIASKNLY